MVDRDELAARFLASLLTKDNGAPRQLADFAVAWADALLARLAETAPAAPPAPTQPTAPWCPKVGDRVRVTRNWANGSDAMRDDEYVVTRLGLGDGALREVYGAGPDRTQYVRVANLDPVTRTAPASREAVARAIRSTWVVGGACEEVSIDAASDYLRAADAALSLLLPGARWPEAKS